MAERSLELYNRVRFHVKNKNIMKVKVIFNSGELGASSARNLGITQAKGQIMAFLDDDAVPFADWAEQMAKTYTDESIVGVTGPIFPRWQGQPANWFPEELDWILGCTAWLGIANYTEVRNVNGTNASFRKKALELAGPYSTTRGPRRADRTEWNEVAEEAELSLRVRRKTGKRIFYNPQVQVHHKVGARKLRWGFIAQRAYQVGHTRHLLRKLSLSSDGEMDILATEYGYLRRILCRFLPQTLKALFSKPIIAWHRLSVAATTLFFVALGYYVHIRIPALQKVASIDSRTD